MPQPFVITDVNDVPLGTAGNPLVISGGTSGGTQDTNLKQVNGATVNVGAGAAGTGTQRVTTSTDSTIGTVTAVTAITNALPVGANVIGKVSIDQTTPGTTNNVVMDGVLDGATFTGTATSAATLVTINTTGYAYLMFGFTSAGSGNTVVIEASNDGTPGTGGTFNATPAYRMDSPSTATTVLPSTARVFIAPVTGTTMRFRISVYGSGTITLSGGQKRDTAPATLLAQTSDTIAAVSTSVPAANNTLGLTTIPVGMPLWSATDLTVLRINNSATSGDTTLVAAVSAQTTRVYRMRLSVAGATIVQIKDGSTVLEVFNFAGNGGALILDLSDRPYYKGSTNANFVLNSSAAVQVDGMLGYVQSA